MLSQLLTALVLMSVCVVIHAAGVTSVLRWMRRASIGSHEWWSWNWLFIRLVGWMILLHLIEITVWALVYVWREALPDLATAMYFSGVTYTTTGYGDLVLPNDWRLVGAVEALTGILMCGWSTGFFFAVASRLVELRTKQPGQT